MPRGRHRKALADRLFRGHIEHTVAVPPLVAQGNVAGGVADPRNGDDVVAPAHPLRQRRRFVADGRGGGRWGIEHRRRPLLKLPDLIPRTQPQLQSSADAHMPMQELEFRSNIENGASARRSALQPTMQSLPA